MKIYDKNGDEIVDIISSDKSYRNRQIMGEHALTLYFSLPTFIEIPVGSYCEYQGQRYTLEDAQNFKKNGARAFDYTLYLESAQARMKKYMFVNPHDGKLKFSYNGYLHEHLNLLVECLNINDTGWEVGEYAESKRKTVEYNFVHCNDALQSIAEAFETEWEVDDQTIHSRKVEYDKDSPLVISYGRGNGVKPGIERTNYENKKQIQRLYVQGGSRNIDFSKYGSNELLLPINKTLEYNGRTYASDSNGYSITGIATTGNEDGIDLSHIYPSRVGTVTEEYTVDADKNLYDFDDQSIPDGLDYSECLIKGENMTVIFQTGMLSGRGEFDVTYNHSTRRFGIVPKEIDGQPMPNETFKPAVGDEYAVFNVMLPDAYVRNDADKSGASWEMFKEAAKYLYDNEAPQYSYTVELDGIWAKSDWLNIGGKIRIGGYVEFYDDHFEPSGALMRIIGVTDNINNPESPTVEISNSPISGSIRSELNKIKQEEVVIEREKREAIDFTKRRWRDVGETIEMIEGAVKGFTSGINPVALRTMLLVAGDESLQFRFVNNTTTPTTVAHNVSFDAETKILTSPAGIIQHMTLGIKTLSSSHAIGEYKFWTLPEFNTPPLVDGEKKYYLYAKVSKTTNTGAFYISETAVEMESVEGFYFLLVGILNSEYYGERNYVSLYGFSEILPGRMTTDKVVSADGQNFIDFINSAARIGNNNTFLDFNTQGDGKFRLKGSLVQSLSGDEQPLGCFRGVYDASYTYYKGDEVTYSGATYRHVNDTASSGIVPTNTTYWTVIAAKGSTGSTGATRYTWIKYSDNADGTNLYDTPTTNTQYIGIAVNKTTATESTNKTDYTWSKFKGDQGVAGNNGQDGPYFEYRYAKNGSTTTPPALSASATSPTGWSTTMPTVGTLEYLWMTVAKKSADGSLLQNWGTPVRTSGVVGDKGDTGDKGDIGPSITFQGEYSSSKAYYGTIRRVDAVKYSNTYYVARTDAGEGFTGNLPTNSNYWNPFGATFDSIATGLLLAELAYIENLIVGRLSSGADDSLPRLIAKDGEIRFCKNKAAEAYASYAHARIGMDVDTTMLVDKTSGKPGFTARDIDAGIGYILASSEGIWCNGSNISILAGSTGVKNSGSIAGVLVARTAGTSSAAKSLNAAVAGIDNSSESSASYSEGYGGYFQKLKAEGLILGCRQVTGSTTLTQADVIISCYNSTTITITLPSTKYVGQTFFIRRCTASTVTVSGNGTSILNSADTSTSINVGGSRGDMGVFIYDGSYWLYNYIPRNS